MEVAASDDGLRNYLRTEFTQLHSDPMFSEAVSGFLSGDPVSQARAPRIRQRIGALAER